MAKKLVIEVIVYSSVGVCGGERWSWDTHGPVDGVPLNCSKTWRRECWAERHARKWFKDHMDCEMRIVG